MLQGTCIFVPLPWDDFLGVKFWSGGKYILQIEICTKRHEQECS